MDTKNRGFGSYFIEPFQQIKIGAYFIFLSLIFMIVCFAIFFKVTYEQYASVMEIFKVVEASSKIDLIANKTVVHGLYQIGGLLILYVLITLFMSVRLSHRIYGPLVSIHAFLDQLIEGDFSNRVNLRKKDELKELVDKLNRLADTLEKKNS